MKNTERKIIEIISGISSESNLYDIQQINRVLHIIMSHSQQAILFISLLEDEFDIEIDDEEINLENFLNFSNIESLINSYIRKDDNPQL